MKTSSCKHFCIYFIHTRIYFRTKVKVCYSVHTKKISALSKSSKKELYDDSVFDMTMSLQKVLHILKIQNIQGSVQNFRFAVYFASKLEWGKLAFPPFKLMLNFIENVTLSNYYINFKHYKKFLLLNF